MAARCGLSRTLVALGLLALLLAGCAHVNAGPYRGPVHHLTGEPLPLTSVPWMLAGDAQVAVYLDAKTGDIQWCMLQPQPGGAWDLGLSFALYSVAAGNAYADCKTVLEARGYVRVIRSSGESSADSRGAPTWCQGPRNTWNGFGCSMQ